MFLKKTCKLLIKDSNDTNTTLQYFGFSFINRSKRIKEQFFKDDVCIIRLNFTIVLLDQLKESEVKVKDNMRYIHVEGNA